MKIGNLERSCTVLLVLASACATQDDAPTTTTTTTEQASTNNGDVASCNAYIGDNPRGSQLYSYSLGPATATCGTTSCGGPIPPTTQSFYLGTFKYGHHVTVGNCGLDGAYETWSPFTAGSSDLEIRTAPDCGGTLVATAASGCGRADRFFTTVLPQTSGPLYACLKNYGGTKSSGAMRVVYGPENYSKDYDLAPGESLSYVVNLQGQTYDPGTSITLGNCGMANAKSYSGNIQLSVADERGAAIAVPTTRGCGSASYDRLSFVLQKTASPRVTINCLATQSARCQGTVAELVQLDSNPGLADPMHAFLQIGSAQTGSGQYGIWDPTRSQMTLKDTHGDAGWPDSAADAVIATNLPQRAEPNVSGHSVCDTWNWLRAFHYQSVQRTHGGRFVLTSSAEDMASSDNARNGADVEIFSPVTRPKLTESLYSLGIGGGYPTENLGPFESGRLIGQWHRNGVTPSIRMTHAGGSQLLGKYLWTTVSSQFFCDWGGSCDHRKIDVLDTTSNGSKEVCGVFDWDDDATSTYHPYATQKGSAVAIARATNVTNPSRDKVVLAVMADASGTPTIDFYEKSADDDGFIDAISPLNWHWRTRWNAYQPDYMEWVESTHSWRPASPTVKWQNMNLVSDRNGHLYLVTFSRGENDNAVDCDLAGDDCRGYIILYSVDFIDGCDGALSCSTIHKLYTLDTGHNQETRSIDAAGAYIDADSERLYAYLAGKYPVNNCYDQTISEF